MRAIISNRYDGGFPPARSEVVPVHRHGTLGSYLDIGAVSMRSEAAVY